MTALVVAAGSLIGTLLGNAAWRWWIRWRDGRDILVLVSRLSNDERRLVLSALEVLLREAE